MELGKAQLAKLQAVADSLSLDACRARLIKSYMSLGCSFDMASSMADRQIQEEQAEDLRLRNNFDAAKHGVAAHDRCREHQVQEEQAEDLRQNNIDAVKRVDAVKRGAVARPVVDARERCQERKRKILRKLVELQRVEQNRKYRKVRDPHGVEFKSFNQMCLHYGTAQRTVKERLSKGCTLEDALAKSNQASHPCVDHLGNQYASVKAMLLTYGINASVFKYRKQKGWDLKRILETPYRVNACVDHLGNKFPSRTAMCNFYKIPRREFYKRLAERWSLKDALTIQYEPRR